MEISAKQITNTSVSENKGIFFWHTTNNQWEDIFLQIFPSKYKGDRMRMSYRSQMWNKHIFGKICFEGVRVLI